MSPRALRYLSLGVIVALTVYTLLAIATLHNGHNWGDDFALYVNNAINLATGRPYAETRFIQNPLYPYLAISYAPPMLPLVLAPTYTIFGLDLTAMKVVLVPFLGASLLLVFLYYRRLIGPAVALLITVAMGLNPYVLSLRESIATEYVFFFFFWLSVLLIGVRDEASTWRDRLIAAACAGVTAYLASATREIGIVLVAAVVFYDLLRRHRLGLDTGLFAAVFLVGYVSQSLLGLNISEAYVGESSGYATLLSGWANLPRNVATFLYTLRFWFPFPDQGVLAAPFIGVFLLLAVLGVYCEWTRELPRGQHLRLIDIVTGVIRGIRFQDVLAGGYMLAICLQPFRAARYLLPVFPIFIFYVVVGAQVVLQRLARLDHRPVMPVLAAVLLYYAGSFVTAKFDNPAEGVHHPQSVQMFEAVRTQLPHDAVVIFRKPRAMALYGQRRSAVWPQRADERLTWRNLADLGATHLVIPRKESGLPSPQYLRYDLKPTPPPFLEPVFANDHFTIYRIVRFPRPEELNGPARQPLAKPTG